MPQRPRAHSPQRALGVALVCALALALVMWGALDSYAAGTRVRPRCTAAKAKAGARIAKQRRCKRKHKRPVAKTPGAGSTGATGVTGSTGTTGSSGGTPPAAGSAESPSSPAGEESPPPYKPPPSEPPPPPAIPEKVECKQTFGPGSGWGVVEGALRSAGARVCLSAGSYSWWNVGVVAPGSLSTVSAAPGARVVVDGLTLNSEGARNLAFENLVFTGTVNVNKGSGFVVAHDEWPGGAGSESGVVVYGNTAGKPVTNVRIEYDRMSDLDEKAGGVGNAQCGTFIGEWEYVTFSHDLCGPYLSGHFTQDGGGNHLTEEYDTFLGPSYRYEWKTKENSTTGYHTNILQIFHPSEYVTFAHNVIRNAGTNGNTILIEGTKETNARYNHITIEDNLFERAEDGQGPGICPQSNFTYAWNTNIYSSPETTNFAVTDFSPKGAPGENDSCESGPNDRVEHNIMVEVPCTHSFPGYETGGGLTEVLISPCPTHHNTDLGWEAGSGTQGPFCTKECAVEYNVTEDNSASQGSSKHYKTGWHPAGSKTSEWATLFNATSEGPYGLESQAWQPTQTEFTETNGTNKFKAGYKGDGGAPTNTGPQN
jgi:hypothetical protein